MAQGGKPFYDRLKAGELRTKLLEDCLLMLSDDEADIEKVKKWSNDKKQLILKMSNNLLPRLNEVTGEGGQPLVVQFDSAFTSSSS